MSMAIAPAMSRATFSLILEVRILGQRNVKTGNNKFTRHIQSKILE